MSTPAIFLAATLLAATLAGPALGQDGGFQTPSGNIHCYGAAGADGFVDCELLERDDPRPLLPQPADCDLDWGARFIVNATGAAGMVCHGDTLRSDANRVLPYGASAAFGPITCVSRESGLECRNAQGHGFVLSRARQSLD